ncbi:MAG: ribosome biogenesis GTP-binding protein YihA/YsxC [Spirochaetales bacterium]
MKINSAEFVTTVASANNILKNEQIEFAFVGRSNVGKSSLINALTNRKNLAKASSTPGKTKHINYFIINGGEFHIVDLPGYGYHQASKQEEKVWVSLIENYLNDNKNLKCVFVLMDIRHNPSELDKQMIAFLNYYHIPYVILATKADKLPKSQKNVYASKIASELGLGIDNIIVTSADEKFGLDKVLQKMEQFM